MPKSLLVVLLAVVSGALSLAVQSEELDQANLPGFLAGYGQSLGAVDQAYEELTSENLPLRDQNSQPLGRRPVEDWRQGLTTLRQAIGQLGASPEDLVLTATLLVQTEALVDNLFDLSQVAYDNDREELGRRFSDLQAVISRDNDLLQAYTLKLAAAKEARIQQLESEKRELEQKLKEAVEQKTKKSPRA